jgi:hypothetical protein
MMVKHSSSDSHTRFFTKAFSLVLIMQEHTKSHSGRVVSSIEQRNVACNTAWKRRPIVVKERYGGRLKQGCKLVMSGHEGKQPSRYVFLHLDGRRMGCRQKVR